jgi:predicted  nucleic acid-binding Zn-ribbon protein
LERRVTTRLAKILRDMAANNRALDSFRRKSPEVRKKIEDELARIPEDSPETRQIRFALRKALLDIKETLAGHESSQAETLLALETELGTGLDRVFTAQPAVPAAGSPTQP